MKLLALLLLPLLIIGSAITPTQPFDEYGNICFEDEKARLDNFAIALQNNENSSGYIIVFAGKQSCRNEAAYRAKRAKDWIVKRGVKADRVLVKIAGYREEVRTILWTVPNGMDFSVTEPGLDKNQISIHKCVDNVFARVLCPNSK